MTFRLRGSIVRGSVVAGLWLCLGLPVFAQSPLSLTDALKLAKSRNGNILSAIFRTKSSEADRNRTNAAFLPTLTPSFDYSTGRSRTYTGALRGPESKDQSSSSEVLLSWQLLDNGSRRYRSVAANRSLEAQREASVRTLRSVLFSVHQSYYDALRNQELLKVVEAQEQRARIILDQTETRVAVGDAAQKEILQARADALNARVNVLQSRTRVATAQADLKAIIGWPSTETLPALVAGEAIPGKSDQPALEVAINNGLRNRNDLKSQRSSLDASRVDIKLAELDAGLALSLDANYRRGFSRNVFDNSALTLSATYPLFDGGARREVIRSRKFSYQSELANLVQAERDAAAEIESAYTEVIQNRERLGATAAALAAAQENFRAASEAQRLGAGTVIDVLTAQVSLVTAESNRVEAVYDTLISEIRLRLATGDEIPGDSDL